MTHQFFTIIEMINFQELRKILWVCGQTRPDISFEVFQLATNIKNSDKLSMENVNKYFQI